MQNYKWLTYVHLIATLNKNDDNYDNYGDVMP